ncbi:hypothetical protein NFI96_001109 [Prochilodus magdalenae]|nr:hypothetical protein NFI96_001109 [Prochilodus magdalenae]
MERDIPCTVAPLPNLWITSLTPHRYFYSPLILLQCHLLEPEDKSWMHTPEALAKHFIAYNAKAGPSNGPRSMPYQKTKNLPGTRLPDTRESLERWWEGGPYILTTAKRDSGKKQSATRNRERRSSAARDDRKMVAAGTRPALWALPLVPQQGQCMRPEVDSCG